MCAAIGGRLISGMYLPPTAASENILCLPPLPSSAEFHTSLPSRRLMLARDTRATRHCSSQGACTVHVVKNTGKDICTKEHHRAPPNAWTRYRHWGELQ